MAYIIKKDHKRIVWEKETTDGTDPAGTRRPFPGKVINITLNENHKHEELDSVGNSTRVIEDIQKTAESYTLEVEFYLGQMVYDDSDLDANLLPGFYGSADAAGLQTHSTPLPTYIFEWGRDGGNPEYKLLKGCKFKTLTETYRINELTVYRATFVGRILERSTVEVSCSLISLSGVTHIGAPNAIGKDLSASFALKGDMYLAYYGTKLNHGGATGTFLVDEQVSTDAGVTTATVVYIDPLDGFLLVKDVSGTFDNSDVITGAKSGATATQAGASEDASGTFLPGEGITETTGGETDGVGVIYAVGDNYLVFEETTSDFDNESEITGGTSTAVAIIAGKTQTIPVTGNEVRELDITQENNIPEDGDTTFSGNFYPTFLAEGVLEVTWTIKFVKENNIFYTIFHNNPALNPGKVGVQFIISVTNGFYRKLDLGVDTSAIFCDVTEHDMESSRDTRFYEEGFSGKLAGGYPVIDWEA